MLNNTIDPALFGINPMNSFGHFSEEPDIHYQPKQNLNMLKESISKLSTDFMQDRMFFQNVRKSTIRRNQFQSITRSPCLKSFDGSGMASDGALPMINQSRNGRVLPVKSPVMESIRMSKQNRSKAFMSLQKYRDGDSPRSRNASDSCSSNSSQRTNNMRKSYISKRNNPKNASMNKGTFFIHKREKSANPAAERNQNIIRASTLLNNSMMFGKKRNSKVAKVKASIVIDKDNDFEASKNSFLRSKRKSKTFVEADMFKNKLVTAQQSKREKVLNPCMESKDCSEFEEIDEDLGNMLLSQKTIYCMPGMTTYTL